MTLEKTLINLRKTKSGYYNLFDVFMDKELLKVGIVMEDSGEIRKIVEKSGLGYYKFLYVNDNNFYINKGFIGVALKPFKIK